MVQAAPTSQLWRAARSLVTVMVTWGLDFHRRRLSQPKITSNYASALPQLVGF